MVSVQRELGFRARKILYAVVTEYIASGEPVGSRTLARRYGLNLSAATIRNELSDLEEAGLLVQPHTSAGRIPTNMAFRLFVDALVQTREVSTEDQIAVLSRLKALRPGVDDVVRETGRMLASLTGAAAVMAPPRPEETRLAQLRFVPMPAGKLLAVIVTQTGAVQNRIVPIERELDALELERVHNYLSSLVPGRSLVELRAAVAEDMASERGRYAQPQRHAIEVVEATMVKGENRTEVLIEGQGVLFDRPEFADAEKIRSVLRAFEERESLLELLDRTLAAGGVQVLIGSETNVNELLELSVVSANFREPGNSTGTLGVIGPTRMDYRKVVPLVGFTAQAISDILDGGHTDD